MRSTAALDASRAALGHELRVNIGCYTAISPEWLRKSLNMLRYEG
jgi:hypothetical protein